MTNCHLKQAKEQEILTGTSDSSGYQMFHVEGCSVCYPTTTCNSFNCFNLKKKNNFKFTFTHQKSATEIHARVIHFNLVS